MKKVSAIVFATCLFIFPSGFFSALPGAITHRVPKLIARDSFKLEKLTIYNPSLAQCDEDPFITASNKRINPVKLQQGAIRWMALSRDMLKRWGGQFDYGDTVIVHTGDPAIDGEWIIQDTMNKRFKNRGDLLFDSSIRSTGMWADVTITKRKLYSVIVDGLS
jgi:hypothetical protein